MAKTDTRPAAFRQDVTLVVRVVVDGTMDEFLIDTDVLRSRIEAYVIEQLPPTIGPYLKEVWAGRGPGGSEFFHPDRMALGVPPIGKHIALDRLPVDTDAERAI